MGVGVGVAVGVGVGVDVGGTDGLGENEGRGERRGRGEPQILQPQLSVVGRHSLISTVGQASGQMTAWTGVTPPTTKPAKTNTKTPTYQYNFLGEQLISQM